MLTILNTQTWQEIEEARKIEPEVSAVAWSPNSEQIALIDNAYTTRRGITFSSTLTVVNTKTWQKIKETETIRQRVSAVAWSPDGEQIALGYEDGRVEIRNASNLQLTKLSNRWCPKPLRGPITTIAWSNDATSLMLGTGYDTTTITWDAIRTKIATLENGHLGDIALHPNANCIAIKSTEGGRIHVRNADYSKQVLTTTLSKRRQNANECLALNSAGTLLAASDNTYFTEEGPSLDIWCFNPSLIKNNKLLAQQSRGLPYFSALLSKKRKPLLLRLDKLPGDRRPIHSLHWSHNGSRLAVKTDTNNITIVNTTIEKLFNPCHSHDKRHFEGQDLNDFTIANVTIPKDANFTWGPDDMSFATIKDNAIEIWQMDDRYFLHFITENHNAHKSRLKNEKQVNDLLADLRTGDTPFTNPTLRSKALEKPDLYDSAIHILACERALEQLHSKPLHQEEQEKKSRHENKLEAEDKAFLQEIQELEIRAFVDNYFPLKKQHRVLQILNTAPSKETMDPTTLQNYLEEHRKMNDRELRNYLEMYRQNDALRELKKAKEAKEEDSAHHQMFLDSEPHNPQNWT